MFRTLLVATVLQLGLVATAMACEGQVGKVIFEDTFEDDSGGWDLTPPQTTIVPPAFLFLPDTKVDHLSAQNLTFHTSDGDYCMDVVLPRPLTPDVTMSIGLEFWAVDYSQYMMLQFGNSGTLTLQSFANKQWTQIFTLPAVPAFKAEPEAVNELRVTALAGKLTIYLNGTKQKTIRVQMPEGNLRFGIYGQFDTKVDASPAIRVTHYKVTSGTEG